MTFLEKEKDKSSAGEGAKTHIAEAHLDAR
jgi:hypothetical protein